MFRFPEVCTLAVGVCGVQSRYQVQSIKEVCTMYLVRVYLCNRRVSFSQKQLTAGDTLGNALVALKICGIGYYRRI